MKLLSLLSLLLVLASCSTSQTIDKSYVQTNAQIKKYLKLSGNVPRSLDYRDIKILLDSNSRLNLQFFEGKMKYDDSYPRTTKILIKKIDSESTQVEILCLKSNFLWFSTRRRHDEHKWLETIKALKAVDISQLNEESEKQVKDSDFEL